MTTDLYKNVKWSDGEEITFGDLNDNQRFLASRLFDQTLHMLAPGLGKDLAFNGQAGADISTAHCYALSAGSAYLRQGSGNNKVQIAPGTLLQKLAAATGNESQLLAYTFVGTEEVTIANGSGGGNYRVDLVQMALVYLDTDSQSRHFEDAVTGALTSSATNKKRVVSCTLSVKQGTPAANPTVPAPDAGTVPIGAMIVPSAYAGGAWNATGLGFYDTAAASSLLCYDLRLPLGVRAHHVWPIEYQYDNAKWTLDTFKQHVTAGAAATALYIPCKQLGGRVLGVALVNNDPSGFTAKFANYNESNGGGLVISNMNTALLSDGSGVLKYLLDGLGNADHFQKHHAPGSGPTVTANANGQGAPVWASGVRGPLEKFRLQSAPNMFDALVLAITGAPSGLVLGPCTFFVAGGL